MPQTFYTQVRIPRDLGGPDIAEEVAAVHLFFNPWRAHGFKAVELPGGWETAPHPRFSRFGKRAANLLRFERAGARPGRRGTIVIETRGGPARLMRLLLMDGGGGVLAVIDPSTEKKVVVPPGMTGVPPSEEMGTYEYLHWVWDEIENLSDTHTRKASLFFFDYDTHSSDDLWINLDKEGASVYDWWYDTVTAHTETARIDVERALESVKMELYSRVNRRAAGDVVLGPGASLDAYVEILSDLQLGLYDIYQDAGMSLTKDLGGAFDKFVRGELRLPGAFETTLEPDSGFFFLFGEFALLAIDHDYEKLKWRNRGRFLVRAQEAFAEAYGKSISGANRHSGHFGPEFFPTGTLLDSAAMKGLETKYASLSYTGLMAQATANVQALMGKGFK